MKTIFFLLAAVLWAFAGQAQTPTGATLFQKAQQQEAAGNRAAAAATYQQAYEAYTSVDDSDGMIKSLARKKAVETAPTASSRPAKPSTSRPAAAPVPAVQLLPGKMVGGRPVGLFFMTRYMIVFRSLEKSTYYFAPTGQVYYNPTDFSAAGLRALSPNSRGTYRVVGSQLIVNWDDGQKSANSLENPTAAGFNWDAGIFVGMGPFANARQLLGSFEGGNSISTSSGGAATSNSLTFRADGTFDRSSAGSVSSGGSTGAVRAGSSSAGTGRWALSGWTLTLTEAGGEVKRSIAFPIEKDDKTGYVTRLFFNGVSYKRQ